MHQNCHSFNHSAVSDPRYPLDANKSGVTMEKLKRATGKKKNLTRVANGYGTVTPARKKFLDGE